MIKFKRSITYEKICTKHYLSVICVVIIAILIICLTLNLTWKEAKADVVNGEKIAYLTENQYQFTNSDVVNGIDIKTYAINNFGSNVTNLTLTNKVIMAIVGDDDIVKILPDSLFKNQGQTFHIGREWGFFVDCFKPYDDINILVSTVILFDLDTNNGDVVHTVNRSHLRFKFKRVLQADYAYVPSSEVEMFSIPRKIDDYLYSDSYQYDVLLNYNDNADAHIIPLPVHYSTGALGGGSSVMIGQHDKYFFTNMVTALSLKNVNAKNYGDLGYDVNTDNGAFISQIDHEMSGFYLTPGATVVEEIGSLTGDFLISKTKEIALNLLPSAVQTVANTYNMIKNTVEDVHEDLKSTAELDENKLTYNAFHNSYSGQSNGYGFLIRNAVTTIKTQREDVLLIGDEEFCFDYQLNGQNIAVDSRYSALFTFGFIKVTSSVMNNVTFGNIIEKSSSISNNIYQYIYPGEDTNQLPYRENDYKEIPEVNAVNGAANFDSHILPNYYNLIKFTSDVTGYYDITGNYKDGNTSNLGISVYEIGNGVTHLNMGNPIKTSAGGKVTSVWLESGKSYFVKSDLMAGNLAEGFYYGDFSLNFKRDAKLVDIGATTVNFDNSGYSYVKIQADGNYYYAFNASGVNIVTLDENMNVLDDVGADGVKLDNGALQYFRIERASSNADSAALTIEKRRKIVYNYDNGQGEETVWVINDNYPTMPTPGAKEGYQYLGWCEPGNVNVHYTQTSISFIDKADIVLIADWAKTYRVRYNTTGGEALPDGVFNERWTAVLRDTAVRDGYIFVGWYDNPNCTGDHIISFPPGTNTDQTVYAKWEPKVFTMTFYNNGSLVATMRVSNGRSFVTPNITKKYHYGTWRSLLSTVSIGGSHTCRAANERFDAQWYVTSPYTVSTYMRNTQYTITDSGVFNQSYDNVFPFTSEETSIYETARIVIQFTAWEKDDGYQHVMLYDGSGTGATLLGERQFEHGGSKKDTNPADYEFVFEINLSSMTNKNLCVRYSASGFGADTWYNNAMTCSITFYE